MQKSRFRSLRMLPFLIALFVGSALLPLPTYAQTPEASDKPTVLWQVQAATSLDTPTGIPTGIAVAPDGTIYISDSQLGLRVFDADGKEQPPIKELPADQITPSGIVVSKAGLCMALPDRPEGALGCFADGKLTLLTGARFNPGSPRAIAINGKGELFALDVTKLVEKPMSKVSVMRFDADGKFISSFVALTDAQLSGVGIVRLATPPVGGVFIITDGPQGIYSFNYDGVLLKQDVGDQPITDLKPTALAFGAQQQTVVAGKKGQIVYNPGSGQPIKFGSKAAAKGEFKAGTFYAPMGMALTENRLYVIDQNEDHTQIVAVKLPAVK